MKFHNYNNRDRRCLLHIVGLLALQIPLGSTISAQVAIHPTTTTPAAWERFSVRVANNTDTATISIRLDLPDAITVLGVDVPPGWTFDQQAGTATSPQSIVWSGGELRKGDFREFSFFGRIKGDARKTELVLPVTLGRAVGSDLEWTDSPGSTRRAQRVAIISRTNVSAGGAVALAGAAIGIAGLALAIALSRKRT